MIMKFLASCIIVGASVFAVIVYIACSERVILEVRESLDYGSVFVQKGTNCTMLSRRNNDIECLIAIRIPKELAFESGIDSESIFANQYIVYSKAR